MLARITTMVTESVKTVDLFKVGVGDGLGPCSPENAGITNSAGRDVRRFIRAMEGFATPAGLLPEQIRDQPDLPELLLALAARPAPDAPYVGACGVYPSFLRSACDGAVF